VVVPALVHGGGVPAVAEFLCAQIERSGRFRLKVFSLSTSSRDASSLRLASPRTWWGHPKSVDGTWQGRPFRHFGAVVAELEFLRLRGSSLLKDELRRCDLIQVVSGSPAPALAAIGCGRPVVLQVATLASVERRKALNDAGTGGVALRAWRRSIVRVVSAYDDAALRAVDSVMVENRWMLDYVGRCVGNGATRVVDAPPGIDCNALTPDGSRARQLVDDPYILFVGRRSDPRKNIALLCRAYKSLCARMARPPRLILAGGGDLPAEAIEALANEPPLPWSISQQPSDAALRELYRGATCVALSSDEEGLGLVLVEAMACGVPVVSTRCGGPEGIVTHGTDGFLAPLDDAEAFAGYLFTLCSDRELNVRMGQRSRETAVARFSAEAAFRPFEETYERLLGRGTSPVAHASVLGLS
jgi:glycosyltransferase involved in cell wall biosynthesis